MHARGPVKKNGSAYRNEMPVQLIRSGSGPAAELYRTQEDVVRREMALGYMEINIFLYLLLV
jgi:hypothetical protein